ncbi:MAG: PIN domain-containing protein [Caldilineaceae bacterium]
MMTTLEPAYLDSSFIVRYLTNDPPPMAEKAAAIIDSDQPLLVSELILAERAYVLSSVYQVLRPDVVDALLAFVQRANVKLTHLAKPIALDALRLCKQSKRVSFADALLWTEVFRGASQQVYTFDVRFPGDEINILRG